ncbi:MAG: hypothetical protein V2I46_04595 [Bacteroides sp.]|nr:hypothetical protein [Bacteroides sp.]
MTSVISAQAARYFLLFLILTFLSSGKAYAQFYPVQVNVMVAPPYSPSLSDYISNPNKMIVTVQTSLVDLISLDIYLHVTISGANEIMIQSKPEFQSANPIRLQPGMVHRLSLSSIQEIFNENNLDFQGITANEVFYGSGLPEDDYQICFVAYSYEDGQMVSQGEPMGCSSVLRISNLEAPIILQPLCHEEITPMTPQNIVFSWTMPAGASPLTQYSLKIVEVQPDGHNIYDAFKSARAPIFFETTVIGNVFLYGPAQPALTPGRTYAFAVKAFDPRGHVNFRNRGMSEICSFKIKKETSLWDFADLPFEESPQNIINVGGIEMNAPPPFQFTTVRGKLNYQYMEGGSPNNYALANANIRLVVAHVEVIKGKNPIPENFNRYLTSPTLDYPEIGKVIATAKTENDGNFNFTFFDNISFELLTSGAEVGFDTYRALVIFIDAPHNNYLFNPELAILPEIGKDNNLSTVTSKVRSYELKVTVKPKPVSTELDHAVGTSVLPGINVYLCRKVDFSYQIYPMEDGMRKNGNPQVESSIVSKFYGFQVVAHGTTGAEGTISFQRVIWHHNPTYQYYLVADIEEGSNQHFSFGAPIPIYPPSQLPSGEGWINPATMEFPKFYNYHTLAKDLFLEPHYPRIFGKVLDANTPNPIEGVSLELREDYAFTPQQNAKILSRITKIYQDAWLNDCVNSGGGGVGLCIPPLQKVITASDGSFAFNDLTLLYSQTSQAVIGPTRRLKVKYPGYKQAIRNYAALDFGKQVNVEIELEKAAQLVGYIRDGETGKGLRATARLLDGNSVLSNPNTGYYKIAVPRLPGQPQQLIVEKQGYISDTLTFIAGQPTQSLDVNLYTVKRRLKVRVFVQGNPLLPIKNCWVHILDVKNDQGFPIGDFTDDNGIVELSFENAGTEANQVYRVRVGMPSVTDRNFETKYYDVKIPVSGSPTVISCGLPRAACLKGNVYAGVGTDSPVHEANVRYLGNKDTLTSLSGLGAYQIFNVPVRFYKQIFTASKSQSNYIGDEKQILIMQPSDQCHNQDFNLTVYDDMDITRLMGFPMEVTKLVATDDGKVLISGNITDLPDNNQFNAYAGAILGFRNIEIKPGSQINENGIPNAEPASLPVNLSTSTLDLTVFNTFGAKLSAYRGLIIDRYSTGSAYGVIKGRVMVPPTEFNISLVGLPNLYLATNTGSGTTKMLIPAFVADPLVKNPVSLTSNGFYLCNNTGGEVRYSFPQFTNAAYADPAKSFLNQNRVSLQTTLHTNCDNTNPRNLRLNVGNVVITKNEVQLGQNNPITLQLGQWKLTSNDWDLSSNGIWLKNATIDAKIKAGIKDLEITYASLKYQNARADFSNITLLNSIPLHITTSNKGLTYVEDNGIMKWKLFAASDGGPQTAYIEQLPGLGNQRVPISLISLLSDGSEPRINVMNASIKLFSVVDFITYSGTKILVYEFADPPYIVVQGKYKPRIQYIDEFAGNMAWEKNTSGYTFKVNSPGTINFIHNNMSFMWDRKSIEFSNDLFTARGTAGEEGKLLPVNIVLLHRSASTIVEIPPNENIFITQDKSKYFEKVVGGMELNKSINKWNNFWFEGEMMGMTGISDNPQKSRIKFVCEGEISAEGQSIKVSKLDDFPGMSFTYDFANSRLKGSLDIHKNLMGMQADGVADCIFDPNGWYLNISGEIQIPGIGGCNLFGLFGDYKDVPPALAAPFGALTCIPSAFQSHVSGFLLQGSLTKELIHPIEWGVPVPESDEVIGVKVNADLSLYARTWMSFDPAVNTYGLSLMAQGDIAGSASIEVFNVSAYAKAQLGIAGVYYSNGNYDITGCGSLSAGASAEFLTPLGWIDWSTPSPEFGLTLKIASTGTDFNLFLGSCTSSGSLCP